MLSPSTVATIKAITPAVAPHAETITRRFYERMFSENPEVKQFFNPAHQHSGGQQKALAGAICAYFANIDNLAVLGPAVELIAQKHCSLGVQPQHYPIVGKHLLAAIGDVLGEAVTPPVFQAVAEAYGFLADVCIDRERAIYQQQVAQPGGWNGFRKFVIGQKVPESRDIMSFYLHPEDGKEVPLFQPGQYLTVKMEQSSGIPTFRNYSISDVPNSKYYRISIKSEVGKNVTDPVGIVSNYLQTLDEGDVIEVGPPCGEFTLRKEPGADRPIIFLAGGIGITPLLTMAKHLVTSSSDTPITFVHAVRNRDSRPFKSEMESLAKQSGNFKPVVVFSEPCAEDISAGHCDLTGVISEDVLKAQTSYKEADYYFCGPTPFMKSVFANLRQLGVSPERIHFEFFGPRQEIN